MMTGVDPQASPGSHPTRWQRPTRKLWVLIGGIAVLCATAVVNRDIIRAHWWARTLAHTDDSGKRESCAILLASLGPVSLPVVMPLLEHADPETRLACIRVLGSIGGDQAMAGLRQACGDSEAGVRHLAVRQLALRAGPEEIALLTRIVASRDERTGMVAVWAMTSSPTAQPLSPFFEAAVRSPMTGVRVEAIAAIEQLRLIDTASTLFEALDDNSVFTGMTEADIHAAAAFDAIRATLASQEQVPAAAPLLLPGRHVVGACAHRALCRLADKPWHLDEQERMPSADQIEAWRQWLSQAAPAHLQHDHP